MLLLNFLATALALIISFRAALFFAVYILLFSLFENERFGRFKPLFATFYAIFLLIDDVTLNSFQTLHTHYLAGLFFASIPFCFHRETIQNLLWQGVRYYTCWVYSCAFLWKFCRGFWQYPLHAKAIILAENATYLAQHHDNFIAKIQIWLIANPSFAHVLLDVGMVVQALFIVGFFTKKLDKWLFILPFLFHGLTYILLDVAFWELFAGKSIV